MENTELLDLVYRDGMHLIFLGDLPMRTMKGNEFKHPEVRILQHIVLALQLGREKNRAGIIPYRLYEFRADYIDQGIDFIAAHFNHFAQQDDLISLKTGAKHEKGTASPHFERSGIDFDNPWFNTLFWGFSSLVVNLNAFIAENIHLVETDEDEEHPVILLLRQHYLQLSPDMRSAVHILSFMHGSGIILPVLFVTGRITASEYASERLALYLRNKEKSPGSEIPEGFPFEVVNLEGHSPEEIFRVFFEDAVQVSEYISIIKTQSTGRESLSDLIANGEGNELEFKSTFRWDLKLGKTNSAVERASLKTITAFLNSAGGTLLIGIRDDGSVEGIESDKFPNEDKFLLHLWTLIRTSLGRDVSPYIQTLLEKKEDRTVCIVKCSRSPKPVFLRQPGFNEEYYIRVGPSSNALDISEALRYISARFREDQ